MYMKDVVLLTDFDVDFVRGFDNLYAYLERNSV